jgi:c-di-GMP-binding flagellar brake protein YcgR
MNKDTTPMSHNSESVAFLEKRKFQRAYFSSTDDVTGHIIIPGRTPPPLIGNITDLSIGGLYLVLKRDKARQIEVADTMTLKEIRATTLHRLELNIDMQIRRIHNYEFVEHVGWGCEFVNISADARAIIRKLVEWGLSARW